MLDFIKVAFFGAGNKGVDFDPAKDIPSLKGKVILVTGGAGGIGKQAVLEFARHEPDRIWVLDLPRDDEGKVVIEDIQKEVPGATVKFLGIDLSSLASVQEAAKKFCATEDKLHIAVLNAGVLRKPPAVTKDGYERHFGINYVGHALLARLLMPVLLRTAEQPDADVRLIVVASEGHKMAPKGGIQFDKLQTTCDKMSYFTRYGQSKVGSIILTQELARQYPQITVAAVHPGRIASDMGTKLKKESVLIWLTTPLAPLLSDNTITGAKNHLWASTAKGVVSGKYYEPVGVPGRESAAVKDSELAKTLMDWTEKELKEWN